MTEETKAPETPTETQQAVPPATPPETPEQNIETDFPMDAPPPKAESVATEPVDNDEPELPKAEN